MGSLNAGAHITQSNNVFGIKHKGLYIDKSNSKTDSTTTIADSGTVRFHHGVSGVVFEPDNRGSVSGVPLNRADLRVTAAGTGILGLNWELFDNSNGNLRHIVTRKISGIHVSVSDREADGSLGPMDTLTERKVFFTALDRTKSSGFADWNIFDNDGIAVGATSGITDIDVHPNATWDA